jgi:tetratricopeptide (TPR) repeat protein
MKHYLFFLLALLLALLSAAAEQAEDAFTETYRTAFIAYKNGQWEEAKTQLAKAEQINAKDPKVAMLKGRIALEEGDFTTAEKLISQALPSDGSADPGYQYLGDVYLRSRNYQKARDAYQNFLRAKPRDPDGMLKIVYADVARNKLAEANQQAGQLDAFSDLHPGYYFAKSAIARASNKNDEAEKILQKARTLYGNQIFAEYLKNYLHIFATDKKAASGLDPTAPGN